MLKTFLHLALGYAEAKELAGETDKLRAYKGSIFLQIRKMSDETTGEAKSEAPLLSIPGLPENKILTLKKLFKLPEIPRQLLIVGGDSEAYETARALHCLGTKVTMVTKANTPEQRDIEVFTGSNVKNCEGGYAMVEQTAGDRKILHKVACDQVLIGSEHTPKRRLFFLGR